MTWPQFILYFPQYDLIVLIASDILNPCPRMCQLAICEVSRPGEI